MTNTSTINDRNRALVRAYSLDIYQRVIDACSTLELWSSDEFTALEDRFMAILVEALKLR